MTMLRCYMAERDFGKGKGIKIAHIDSGINEWHPHAGKIAGGVAFHVSGDGRIYLTGDYADQLGHGTAVAGVIKEQAPEAELWSLKIFHDSLTTHIEVLCTAMEWCLEARMDIVNLSLGVRKDVAEFQQICRQAAENGVMIVAACDEANGLVWPGFYDSVLGVKAGQNCTSEVFYYHPYESAPFLAAGLPRRLEGPMQKFNFQGHSFAAAHVTGFVAKLKERYGIRSKWHLEEKLFELFAPVKGTCGSSR